VGGLNASGRLANVKQEMSRLDISRGENYKEKKISHGNFQNARFLAHYNLDLKHCISV